MFHILQAATITIAIAGTNMAFADTTDSQHRQSFTVNITLPTITQGDYQRPYVAMWVATKKNRHLLIIVLPMYWCVSRINTHIHVNVHPFM